MVTASEPAQQGISRKGTENSFLPAAEKEVNGIPEICRSRRKKARGYRAPQRRQIVRDARQLPMPSAFKSM